MSTKSKVITVAILAAIAFVLAYVIWIQTRLLIGSLLILAVVVLVGYFIVMRS